MRAGFMEKPGKIYYTQSREPMIERDTDVKIQVKAAGICGSEVHAFHGKHPFRIPPVVSGHEFAGVVCLLYTSPSPRDKRQSRMPSSA